MELKQADFYPIPYVKELVLNAPEGTLFNFSALKSAIPEEDFIQLTTKSKLKYIMEVIKELEDKFHIKVAFNVVDE